VISVGRARTEDSRAAVDVRVVNFMVVSWKCCDKSKDCDVEI